MSPSFDITPIHSQASQALLRERLAQLEAALLEARGRVMLSFDRELASLRGWMNSLERFDPTQGLHALKEPAPEALGESLQELIAEPPHPAASNIVPFSIFSVTTDADGAIREQPLDPTLANATLEELNAALAAAFQHMAQKPPLAEPRSA